VSVRKGVAFLQGCACELLMCECASHVSVFSFTCVSVRKGVAAVCLCVYIVCVFTNIHIRVCTFEFMLMCTS